ncbi:hypothetical protein [Nostoc sp.]
MTLAMRREFQFPADERCLLLPWRIEWSILNGFDPSPLKPWFGVAFPP